MRKGCVASLIVVGVFAAGLTFLALFYTSERVWSSGSMVGERIALVGERIAQHPALAAAMRECLAAHDPAALAGFNRTGTYRTSGWFVDDGHLAAVTRCMRQDGWLLTPTRLYIP